MENIDEMLKEIHFEEDDVLNEEPEENVEKISLDDFVEEEYLDEEEFFDIPEENNSEESNSEIVEEIADETDETTEESTSDEMDDIDDLFMEDAPKIEEAAKEPEEPEEEAEELEEETEGPEKVIEETLTEDKPEKVSEELVKEIEEHIEEEVEEVEKEPMKNSTSALESFKGEEGHLSSFAVSSPVSASINIIRFDGDKPVLIAMGPTKLISCTDEEAKILLLDHVLKTQEISDKDKRAMFNYEITRKKVVKKIFGTDDIAKINNLSKEEFKRIMVGEEEKPKSLIENLSEELGINIDITPELAEAKDETELLKLLLKEKGK